MNYLREFFAFAREREKIRLAKESGAPWPWTKDRVLQQFYFCNVFREDDRTTRWFRTNVRSLLSGHPRVLIATVAFRWFNLISTGELLRPMLLEEGWNRKTAEKLLRGKKPLVTGAFVVKSPNGTDKLTGLCDCIDTVAEKATRLGESWRWGDTSKVHIQATLQQAHTDLMEFPYLGKFMAYEIVTDLLHTYLLKNATDINTWASAGPGCARGLGWVVCGDPTAYGYTSNSDQVAMLEFMQQILAKSRMKGYWPSEWRQWSMREVEHTLCEFDKYCRAKHQGSSLKRRYRACK